jgi:hypothetical protein
LSTVLYHVLIMAFICSCLPLTIYLHSKEKADKYPHLYHKPKMRLYAPVWICLHAIKPLPFFTSREGTIIRFYLSP